MITENQIYFIYRKYNQTHTSQKSLFFHSGPGAIDSARATDKWMITDIFI
jgi:hypothetical protein